MKVLLSSSCWLFWLGGCTCGSCGGIGGCCWASGVLGGIVFVRCVPSGLQLLSRMSIMCGVWCGVGVFEA